MKHTVCCLLLITCLITIGSSHSHAQGSFGVGLILGEPTGISWKYKLNRRNAFDGAIGISPFDRMRLQVDYLWMSRPFNDQSFIFSYGVGMAVGFGERYVTGRRGVFGSFASDAGFAARVPLSLTYDIPRSPVELGFEIAPLIIFGPNSGFGMDGGILIRFYP